MDCGAVQAEELGNDCPSITSLASRSPSVEAKPSSRSHSALLPQLPYTREAGSSAQQHQIRSSPRLPKERGGQETLSFVLLRSFMLRHSGDNTSLGTRPGFDTSFSHLVATYLCTTPSPS